MRSCSLELTRQGTYATLEPSRVTAARLLEFYIQIYYINYITKNPFNFLAPGRHPDP